MNSSKISKSLVEVSIGESLRIMREFNELSQSALAKKSGIPQATISAIENDEYLLE